MIYEPDFIEGCISIGIPTSRPSSARACQLTTFLISYTRTCIRTYVLPSASQMYPRVEIQVVQFVVLLYSEMGASSRIYIRIIMHVIRAQAAQAQNA